MNQKLVKTKLCSRNLVKGINSWAVPVGRYTGPFFNWKKGGIIEPENKKHNYDTQGLT